MSSRPGFQYPARELKLSKQDNLGPIGHVARESEAPMNLRTTLRVLLAVASRFMRALTRVAKRWAAPGAGPELMAG